MKFSWKWLNQLIDLQNIPLNQIIHKLTLAGFEVEDITNIEKIHDKTLDINITANRVDTASIVGLARELSTIFNLDITYIANNYHEINTSRSHTINSKNINSLSPLENHLLDIQFQTINHINVTKTPQWLQNHLIGCDIIPNNILTDITKYINIKWGQKIEIFDINKIDNEEFKINLLNITEISDTYKYTRRDHKINKIDMQVLNYKQKPVSTFGVESNPKFSCNHNTSSILILGYICHPNYINKLNNTINQSQKHKKVISRNDFSLAYQETINLLCNLTDTNTKFTPHYQWHEKIKPLKTININQTQINNVLGPLTKNKGSLNIQNTINILKALKFQPIYRENNFTVTIPEYRESDIKRPIDVIEEIGRIYGFNKFIDKLPSNHQTGKINNITAFIKKVRDSLRNLGLHEVIHYSLENSLHNKSNTTLYNPLQEDQTHLRNSLIYHLLNTIKYNKQQKNSILECFEIGRVFHKKLLNNNRYKYIENISLAGILGRNEFSKNSWSTKGKELNWFQAKGLIETLFEELHSSIIWGVSKKNTDWLNIYHPYRYAILQNSKTKEIVGTFGELNINFSKKLSNNHHIYFFELNLLKLMKTIQISKHLSYSYKQYSNYPSVTRDISLILDRTINSIMVKEFILSKHNEFVQSVKILNEYNNNNNRTISFRITYRSNMKTLNDKDIQKIDQDINTLFNKLN
uniref:phenylalanine-tRNA ligase beta subunit n=1 Tax=Caulacanthus ustulatus TaxID=31411 RepID=UPI0027DA650B|nr:phenylalanine-tRNA ligase beta subunit [Caulacanthus ustulatus]WCH57413.1 phenylalanine-tRNA ligase beta subunit [Caulacanthus ustulatus]